MAEKDSLLQHLQKHADSDIYPYHMPGHKRNLQAALQEENILTEAAGIDITEIDGFDNLHAPEGILKEAMENAAALYGAEEAYYSINGSTAGLLTAISAVVPEGSTLIMARNCHKAVYHAVYLRRLKPVYLYPETLPGIGIAGAITKEQAEQALAAHPEAAAVLITSPTYDGITADVEQIAQAVHAHNIPLIVDAAHGAHFGFHPEFPDSPVHLGADLTVVSLHKTMPCMTQTALLLVKGSRVSKERLRMFEGMYQTSSPSYVLMASMDACMMAVKRQKDRLWDNFWKCRESFLKKTEKLQFIEIITADRLPEAWKTACKMDAGKILLKFSKTYLTGQQFYDILLRQYHLQMEMAAGDYVTAIMTCCDTEEGWQRLADVLCELDERAADGTLQPIGKADGKGQCRRKEGNGEQVSCLPEESADSRQGQLPYPQLKAVVSLTDALDAPKESVLFSEAVGKISGAFVNLYPPGIPIVVPGERISKEVMELIIGYRQQNLPLQGAEEDALYILS